ncbi:MAG: hypothetical protein R3315_10680 [Woeseiaceae bacterium]|nr:hypothetical protein [Woeseiaceae bacterium]
MPTRFRIMKLRIKDNSVRLRLTKSEVDQAKAEGIVSARTRFADGAGFDYVLESSPASVAPTATFEDGRMLVRLPADTVDRWADSDQVTIAAEQPLDDGAILSILVEKDFACLSPREDEDESDLYEHPDAGQKTC